MPSLMANVVLSPSLPTSSREPPFHKPNTASDPHLRIYFCLKNLFKNFKISSPDKVVRLGAPAGVDLAEFPPQICTSQPQATGVGEQRHRLVVV